MQGTTGSISVAGMMRLLCNYGRTGRLNVKGEGGKGHIDIFEGKIAGAGPSAKGESVKEAAINLLTILEEGSFYFDEGVKTEGGNKEELFPEEMIMESARRLRQSGKNVKDYIPSDNEVMKITRMPGGKNIFTPFAHDEWNMLAAFGGDTSVGAVIDEHTGGRKAAEAILYGLVSAGLVRKTRFKIPEVERIAREELGNIGAAIVDSSMAKLKINRAKMGMKEMISLLNSLETDFSAIAGKTKAKSIIEKIWAGSK